MQIHIPELLSDQDICNWQVKIKTAQLHLKHVCLVVLTMCFIKEQPKLDLKQPEPKPKISFWFRFRFSRTPKFDILFRPRLCRNQLFSRNRNKGYHFGRNR